jgi:hypothetical protein
MEIVVVAVGVIILLAVGGWMYWSAIAKRGPWQATTEEPNPHAGEEHPEDITRGADRPAGPGAEDQFIADRGTTGPAPPE